MGFMSQMMTYGKALREVVQGHCECHEQAQAKKLS